MQTDRCDVIVVGAGLSGLATALLLKEAGLSVTIMEAQDQLGGRIRSIFCEGRYQADLGPTWVWPMYQPILARWMDRLGVSTFEQFNEGNAVLDLERSASVRHQYLPGQHGMVRPVGGPQSLIDALVKRLKESKIVLNTPVLAIEQSDKAVKVVTNNATFMASRVVLASPLRITEERVGLPNEVANLLAATMRSAPTWMATQAKAIALFDKAFWRERGLSGRIASHVGPIVEGHDHSSADQSIAALFGFIGVPHKSRMKLGGALSDAVRQQLAHCFGDDARGIKKLEIYDWANNEWICSAEDRVAPPQHPLVLHDAVRQPYCDGRLYFAASETADTSPGIIEGAFSSAERVAAQISNLT